MSMNGSFNMVERKEPKFVQFGAGESVAGVLVAIEKAMVGGKPAARYVVQDIESGELSAFLGTAQINTKLRRTDLGHMIDIRCEGTDRNVVKNGNPMKVFRVLVSDKPCTEAASVYITDDDIPNF